MATILDKIKYGINNPTWLQMPSPFLNAHSAGGCICADKRNDISNYRPVVVSMRTNRPARPNLDYPHLWDCRRSGCPASCRPAVKSRGAGSRATVTPSEEARLGEQPEWGFASRHRYYHP